MKLHLDFESYYSTENNFDLKSLSMTEYIRDPRFKALGAGAAFDDEPIVWISAKNLDSFFLSLKWDEIDLVGHNVKFDGAILAWRYGYVPRSYIDTKGMSRACLAKSIKNHSLGTIAEYFQLPRKQTEVLDSMNGKSELTPEEESNLAGYCIHDVELEREILHRFEKEFPHDQYASLDQTIRMFVEPKLQLNINLLHQTALAEEQRRLSIFNEIKLDKKVFASNEQFAELLQKEGFEVPMKRSPKRKDEKGDPLMIPALALGDIKFQELCETPNERLQDLCEARVAAKSNLLQTRSTKLARIGATGLWSFDVEFSGADQTHRFSGGGGAGGNPQNFTNPARVIDPLKKEMASALRRAVTAPDGYELVVGDFSQIEFRLVAYLSRDPGLLELIEKDKDAYIDFGSAFFGFTLDKERDKAKRQFAKTAMLGLGYQMGSDKFIQTVRTQTGQTITEETAKKAVDLYRKRYGYVQSLWNSLRDLIPLMTQKENAGKYSMRLPVKIGFEYLELPSGLKIRFPNLREEIVRQEDKKTGEMIERMQWVYDVYTKGHKERRTLYGGKVLENICQGLAGELCKDAMVRLGENVVGQVHDELHVLCRKGSGSLIAQNMKRIMSLPPEWMPDMILDAEVKVGQNWADCK